LLPGGFGNFVPWQREFLEPISKLKNAKHPNLSRHAGLDPASSKQLFLLDSGFRRNDEYFYG
jgi:hypothetical protein